MKVPVLSRAQASNLTPEELEFLEQFRVDPLEPGHTPENPLPDQAPGSTGLRAIVKNLAANPEVALRFIQEQGWEAYPLGDLNFSVRRPGDRLWYRLDPMGPDLQDITDLGGDVLLGTGQVLGMMGGAAASPVLGPAGPYAGGAAGGAAAEGLRQAVAQQFGMEPSAADVGTSMGIEAGLGAAGPLVAKGVRAAARHMVPHSAGELLHKMTHPELVRAADQTALRAGAQDLPSEAIEQLARKAQKGATGDWAKMMRWPKSAPPEPPRVGGLAQTGPILQPQTGVERLTKRGVQGQAQRAGGARAASGRPAGGQWYTPGEVAQMAPQMPRQSPLTGQFWPQQGAKGMEARALAVAKGEIPGAAATVPHGKIPLPRPLAGFPYSAKFLTEEQKRKLAAQTLARQPLSEFWSLFNTLAGGADVAEQGLKQGATAYAMQRFPGNMGSAWGPLKLAGMGIKAVGALGRKLTRSVDPWHRILRAEGKTSRLGRYVVQIIDRFTRGDVTGAKAMVYTILQRPEWRDRIYRTLGGKPQEDER